MLKNAQSHPSLETGDFLRIYQIEPFGRLFLGWLRLPLPLVWLIFVFLYFGMLLLLHSAEGTPKPTNPGDLFRNPATIFYYPNLVSITFDLIGNPLLFFMLIAFRNYIPRQFLLLEQNGFIRRKSNKSGIARSLSLLSTSSRFQKAAIIALPLLDAIGGLVVDILVYAPQGAPARYAILLAMLGRYARSVILVQIGYAFIILSNHEFCFRLYLNHPDECSGLAPFGRLALAAYFYLFVFAMIQAVGIAAGGSSFERIFGNIAETVAFSYLWILFPITSLFVFNQFIYGPHRVLKDLQFKQLLIASLTWTRYHNHIWSSILSRFDSEIEQPKVLPADKPISRINDDLDQLEALAKLNKNLEDMYTWPISKRALRILVVLVNPLLPILLPLAVDTIRNLLP